MLTPITYWLYSESLPQNLTEEICEKLIVFSEQIPPLSKMAQPCQKYLKYLRLKTCNWLNPLNGLYFTYLFSFQI